MFPSLLKPLNEGSSALHDPAGLHVGNFKWIKGQWKFKAIGYGLAGQVMPGHGPLTAWHNSSFAQLDEAIIRAQFFQE
ncbi:hypothetical protein B9Z47_07875 [Limnohabitans sp. 2KL-1]|jgi:hypothetical protein|uniref:hypothetical protein n=1 Tax=Limnohabitans sp. 2KL-1 TaxID=1100699 RepID=UPI000D38DA9B|nr:hypothetical protein [Limnohabitans sp. 2KL-1]PUE49375.1 hypothetical protein B9Z47_07875 [Limnohabitans sp. 2KL-1]